MAAETDD